MGIITYITKKLNLSKTKETIIQNLFWAVLGKVVALLSGLIVGIIVARYLGPERYVAWIHCMPQMTVQTPHSVAETNALAS